MAIWVFDTEKTGDLYKILEHIDELEELGIQLDGDMLVELRAEITKREEKPYSHLITFEISSNESGDSRTDTILLHFCPDEKRAKEMVENSYDGVWVPDTNTIKVYNLGEMP